MPGCIVGRCVLLFFRAAILTFGASDASVHHGVCRAAVIAGQAHRAIVSPARFSLFYRNIGHRACACARAAAGACVRDGKAFRLDPVVLETRIYNRSLQPSKTAARHHVVRRRREVVLHYGFGYGRDTCRCGSNFGAAHLVAVDIEARKAYVRIGHLNGVCRPMFPSAI